MLDSIDEGHLENGPKRIWGGHLAVTRSTVELLWEMVWKLLFIWIGHSTIWRKGRKREKSKKQLVMCDTYAVDLNVWKYKHGVQYEPVLAPLGTDFIGTVNKVLQAADQHFSVPEKHVAQRSQGMCRGFSPHDGHVNAAQYPINCVHIGKFWDITIYTRCQDRKYCVEILGTLCIDFDFDFTTIHNNPTL